jgi:hypothetical protein
MKHIIFNKDGSVLIEKEFFEEVMEKNEILDLTLVIERRAGQINFLGSKIKRQPK